VDNRTLEGRPDVLVYTTPPLTDDIEVIGPVRLELYVRSSLAHTDFFGRLCDVHANGRSVNICDGLFRIEPGQGEPQSDGSLQISVDMWATAHRFRRGHCLRLQVSSGAHPRWSRNLGTGEPLGTGTRMMAAEQTIYHDRAHPSALVLPITS
jgi:putative CocE/NonD family hydrolase